MSGEERARIDCFDTRGTSVTVIEVMRDRSDKRRPADGAGSSLVYYTSTGYLVEPLSDGNFRVALSGEVLIRR